MTVVKIVSVRVDDDTVYDAVYTAEGEGELVFAGMLKLSVGAWQMFGALLRLGAGQTHGRVTVILEGDEQVVR